MKNKRILMLVTFLFILMIGCLISFNNTYRNPYKDVEWIIDHPGATDRHITFTPVLKNNRDSILGPTVGADFGKLKFKDLDNDGVKEVIIETSFLLYEAAEYYYPIRHILKSEVDKNRTLKFKLIKTEEL